MKRLTLFLLFLTCHFLLPQQEPLQHGRVSTGKASFLAFSPSSASLTAHLGTPSFQQVKPWKEIFKRRPVGLNDGHVEGPAVYSCHIRPLFIYIHTFYRTYAQTFRDVAINLSDWRGPPAA